jgi:hypothetical protein
MEVMEKPAAGNWEKFSAINKRGEWVLTNNNGMEMVAKSITELSFRQIIFRVFESLVQPLWDIWRRFIGT